MRSLIFITLLSFLSNCASFDLSPPERKIVPNDRTGCDEYKKEDKAKCVSELISAYRDFRNAEVVKNKISSRRHNEYWVINTYEYCFVYKGKKFDCFLDEDPEKDRTLKGWIQDHTITSVPALLIGAYLGFKL